MDSQWEYTAESSQGYSQPSYSYPPQADASPLTGETDFEAQSAVHALLYPTQTLPVNPDVSSPRSTDQQALHAALQTHEAQHPTYENIPQQTDSACTSTLTPPAQRASLSSCSTSNAAYTNDATGFYGSNYQYYHGAGSVSTYCIDPQPITTDFTGTSNPSAVTTRGGGWTSTPTETQRVAPRPKFRVGARAWYRLELTPSTPYVVDVTGAVYNATLGCWQYEVSFNSGEYTWESVPEANLSRYV